MRNPAFTAEALKRARKAEIAASGENGKLPNYVMEDALFQLMPWASKASITDLAPAYGIIGDILIAQEGDDPSPTFDKAVITDLCERVAKLEVDAESTPAFHKTMLTDMLKRVAKLEAKPKPKRGRPKKQKPTGEDAK